MIEAINYNAFFNQALQQIKRIRNPHSDKPEQNDLMWNAVLKQSLFNFGGDNLKKYSDIVDAAKNISISCLSRIIYNLQKDEHLFDSIDSSSIKEKYTNICFVLKDLHSDALLIFKEIEECSFWKLKDKEPEDIQLFMQKNEASSCKYVYLMFEYAYLQIIGHNDDMSDPGRGYNVYSIKWFFETYLGEDEYPKFHAELRNYIQEVNDYLGYILIKSLTPNAMINFKKITERSIIKFPFEILREKRAKKYELPKDDFIKIKDQFIGEKTYLVMLGDHHFSESLVTAEWLYDSMKKAQAIDLTVIGMGYFKAVEQLLFELICLHKNENRKGVCVDNDSIRDNILDTTIGAMANFYKDNLDILNEKLSWRARKYIRETIFDYKNLRNGYFHKDNIHNWDKIEEIRIESFSMIFLLLGAQKLTNDDLTQLGIPNNTDEFSDYARLCEYVNFHSGNLFFLNFGGKEDKWVLGCCDMYSKVVDNKYIKYSGVYFSRIDNNARIELYREKDLPKDIYLGKLVFDQTEMFDAKPFKKIFENGKFIGPSIIEEENFDY